jgi:hypothetical protein
MTERIITDSNGRKHITNEPQLHPLQRTWVGLTYEEKHEIRYSHMTSAEFIEFIEAKLKQKNGYAEEKNT